MFLLKQRQALYDNATLIHKEGEKDLLDGEVNSGSSSLTTERASVSAH